LFFFVLDIFKTGSLELFGWGWGGVGGWQGWLGTAVWSLPSD
jgi:hypothetical protein